MLPCKSEKPRKARQGRICNPRDPRVSWEVETGESMKARRPANLVYLAVTDKEHCPKVGDQPPQLSSDLHVGEMNCACLHYRVTVEKWLPELALCVGTGMDFW